MISLLLLLSAQGQIPDRIVYADTKSPASLDRERRVREFVRSVIQSSGAHFRDETGRAPREEELVGRIVRQETTFQRFVSLDFASLLASISPDGSIRYTSQGWPKLPSGARPWTAEECGESARRTVAALLPADLRARVASAKAWGPEACEVEVAVVPAIDPRPVVREVRMRVDAATGMPMNAETLRSLPKIDPARAVPLVPEAACAAEAERVYRSIAPYAAADPPKGEFVYRIPAFSNLRNEMTDELRALEREKGYTALYVWEIHEAGRSVPLQCVIVDARTGKTVAWLDPSAYLAGGGPVESKPVTAEGRWTLGAVSGLLTPSEETATPQSRHILTAEDGRRVLVLLDEGKGLLTLLGRTYRPDAALLKALRAEKAPVPFGKR